MKLTRKIITNNYYQEHSLQTAGEITDRNLESQKEIIKSFQSVWLPNVENAYELFWNKWMSPRSAAGIYARTVSSFADNSIATTRIANNAIVANTEAINSFIKRKKDDVKEFSRLAINAAKSLEQTSRDTASTQQHGW